MLKKVLVIDDSAVIRRKYTLLLKRYGCDIIEAKNGKEGFERLTDDPDLDLILLGIHMPVMDGIGFLKTVLGSNRHGHIPIVLLTTDSQDEEVLRGISLGAQGYVKKSDSPYTFHELLERLSLRASSSLFRDMSVVPEKQNNEASRYAGCRLVM